MFSKRQVWFQSLSNMWWQAPVHLDGHEMAWKYKWLHGLVYFKIMLKSWKNNETNIVLDGKTIVGNNAYVKRMYMTVPLKGMQTGHFDTYNFYLSQIRITIERSFGVSVHRWAILRSPLAITLCKVSNLLMCLCYLNNFWINCNEYKVERLQLNDVQNVNDHVDLPGILIEVLIHLFQHQMEDQ